jgi:uncharacterized membrane protein
MEVDLTAWLNLAIRWVHLITGIAWIGSSFYFIWLDNSLVPPEDDEDKKAGVGGEVWAVHGGGFYHKKKYKVAPAHMPDDLHWFKWEAYFTWLSGFLLLSLIYYHGASLFLIDQSKMAFTPWQAVGVGVGAIVVGWLFYDTLCKSPLGKNSTVFGVIWYFALVAAAYALCQIFTDRGAFIHVGAIVGSCMAFNVFMIIIPNQKKVVASLLAGEKPDPLLGIKAKQRSTHNNYMTLPVLLIMVSNHYPMIVGHQYNWVILSALGAVAWPVREFFNKKHKRIINYYYPAAGAVGFVLVMLFAAYTKKTVVAPSLSSGQVVTSTQAMAIAKKHCVQCHSVNPTHTIFTAPPANLTLDSAEDLKKNADRIYAQAVAGTIMPLGNETGMTTEERAQLGSWLKNGEQ